MMLAMTAALTLGAAPAAAAKAAPVAGEVRASDRDCAVVAAVALQVYRYDRWTPPSLQVTQGLDGGRTWRLACDWSAYGLTFPETYSHVDHPRPRRWLRIDRPIYEGGEAVVETAYVPGPRAGMGRRCRLREGANGRWTLIACERDWVS